MGAARCLDRTICLICILGCRCRLVECERVVEKLRARKKQIYDDDDGVISFLFCIARLA